MRTVLRIRRRQRLPSKRAHLKTCVPGDAIQGTGAVAPPDLPPPLSALITTRASDTSNNNSITNIDSTTPHSYDNDYYDSPPRLSGLSDTLITNFRDRCVGSILMRIGHTDEILSIDAVAKCIADDKGDLFSLHNTPRLYETLEAITDAFITPSSALRYRNGLSSVHARGSQRGRGLGNALHELASSPKPSSSLAVGTRSDAPTNSAEPLDLSPIRSAVAKKAKMRLPTLSDAFPWLAEESLPFIDDGSLVRQAKKKEMRGDEGDKLSGILEVIEGSGGHLSSGGPSSSSSSSPPPTKSLDPILFTTRAPSRWGTTLNSVPLSSRNTKEIWLDVFHALSNNSAWAEASSHNGGREGIESAHQAVLKLISEYKTSCSFVRDGQSTSQLPSCACAEVVSFSDAQSMPSRSKSRDGLDAHRRAKPREGLKRERGESTLLHPHRSCDAHSSSSSSSSSSFAVLCSALTPQWLRKMRGHYLKLHRIDLYISLFKACVETEEFLASSALKSMMAVAVGGVGSEAQSPKRIVVSSIVADYEHLGFYTVLLGRREAAGSKATRWQGVLDAFRWSLPRVVMPSPHETLEERLTNLFKLVANVCVYINNDGNEDRRVRQLIGSCVESGVGDCFTHSLLLTAIDASLVDKIAKTKGGCTPSALRCISVILTIRHRLAALERTFADNDDNKDNISTSSYSSEKRHTANEAEIVSSHLRPLLYARHPHAEEDTDATTPTQATPQCPNNHSTKSGTHPPPSDESVSEAILAMPAPIVRSPDDHVAYMAKAVQGVVSALVECFEDNKSAVTASTATLVKWIQREIRECTPISDWRKCTALVRALGPIQEISTTNHLTNPEEEEEGAQGSTTPMPRELLTGHSWECGCGADNTFLAKECWSCEASGRASPCTSCGADLASSCLSEVSYPSGRAHSKRTHTYSSTGGGKGEGSAVHDNTPCSSCATPHPRAKALQEASLWACRRCSTLSNEQEELCTNAKCMAPNPLRERHSCGHCGHSTVGLRDPMCSVCGEATAGLDARLVLCRGCTRLYPLHNNPSCPHCRRSELSSGPKASLAVIPHFTWRCGCGTQNSPLTVTCRTCAREDHGEINKAVGSATHAHPVAYTCSSCSTKTPPVRRRIIPTFPGLHPYECKVCDTLHPQGAALFSRRATSCPACHAIIPLGTKRCGSCGTGAIDAKVPTRFLPSFASLPWHCHSCGDRNVLVEEDAESALRCASCDVDRVNPLLFSESSAWDCLVCGTERNYGFACRQCHATHGSIPDAEVCLWRCDDCKAYTPSWRQSCMRCSAARPKGAISSVGDSDDSVSNGQSERKAKRTENRRESPKAIKYVPWRCDRCAHYNSPSQIGGCEKCRAQRPEVPQCSLCRLSHLDVHCSTRTAECRETGLETILMEAAERKEDPLIDLDMSVPSIFDDVLNDMPLIL